MERLVYIPASDIAYFNISFNIFSLYLSLYLSLTHNITFFLTKYISFSASSLLYLSYFLLPIYIYIFIHLFPLCKYAKSIQILHNFSNLIFTWFEYWIKDIFKYIKWLLFCYISKESLPSFPPNFLWIISFFYFNVSFLGIAKFRFGQSIGNLLKL